MLYLLPVTTVSRETIDQLPLPLLGGAGLAGDFFGGGGRAGEPVVTFDVSQSSSCVCLAGAGRGGAGGRPGLELGVGGGGGRGGPFSLGTPA